MIYLFIALAIGARFVPHMLNFAPITAIGIFAGANLNWKKATALVLAVRFVSDLYLGFFAWPLMLAVYAAHLSGIVLGVWLKRQKINYRWLKVVGSSLAASAIFFLLTNFAFLYAEYPHNWAGITQAYANGLPFLRGTLLGDLSYTAALFGGLAAAKYLSALRQNQKALSFK